MNTALVTAETHTELLVIERLAAALEKAASVDEIKDVRDRAMAIQLYTRKKAGGLAACQSAGRVVTEATLMLARLYHEEKALKGGRPAAETRVRDHEFAAPGKVAVAKAADLDHSTLSRLKPLVQAAPETIKAATVAIEAAGEVATPAALLRHVTSVSSIDGYDGDEWYTPAEIIDAARAVLGTIDLDPASNVTAQKVVRATTFMTKVDNSLTKEWHGNVFCNPPYSTSLVQEFTDKLIAEVASGRTKAAIYLVNNCTETAWFQALATRFAFCLPLRRLAFYGPTGAKQAARQGQTIFYAGPHVGRFVQVFSAIGVVVGRVQF
jgi:ParB family chromosome partitioning protein